MGMIHMEMFSRRCLQSKFRKCCCSKGIYLIRLRKTRVDAKTISSMTQPSKVARTLSQSRLAGCVGHYVYLACRSLWAA